MKELKQLDDYYKNNEIDMDKIIEDFAPYITTTINNGTNSTISLKEITIMWKIKLEMLG